ncbi:MAG: ABC transporter permease [Candidatus Moranbacteria bacterium]|nr:ABC transporter permease [Candidatus Moranbacteria bacterium]MDD5652220.1 ABC transporter permease [Candidatus Moranbacteria bacterium]MDX9855410.1 ABC transporter permease [Candidatus Moranbacteria bacterium]
MTVAGIGVGIGSIFFLVSLGYGVQKVVLEKIATSDSLLSLDVFSSDKEKPISSEDVNVLEQVDGVSKISPVINQKTKISGNNFTTDSTINIVNQNFFSLEGITVKEGELFEDSDTDKIVVTQAVLDLLHIGEDDFEGRKITIVIEAAENGSAKMVERTYEVIGSIKDKSKANIYVPSSSVRDLGFSSFSRIKVKASSDGQVDAVRNSLMEKGYFVSAISDTVDQTRKIFRVIQIVLLSFGMLALIVSAIGMFNTMTISLLERTQEIAIMKSLGASVIDIWSMFLAESVLIGFSGGTMGVALGYASTEAFNLLLNFIATRFGGASVDLFAIPIWFVFFIVVFSTAVGLITGFYPARRAANLDTLEALRYK